MKKLLLGMLIICLLPIKAGAFSPPVCGDPWYYQSNDKGIMFMVPDKAQHYWGSYGLSILGCKYLGNTNGVVAAFAAGFIWEVKDNYNQKVGFSYRDLIADALGILSNRVNTIPNTSLYLTYNTNDRTILFNASWIF